MAWQRYVSPDLTHFVGQSIKTQRKRYLLLRRILRTGVLKARLRPTKPGGDVYVFRKDVDVRLSTNMACEGSCVCFCDIPISDVALHMNKYSRFGVAFSKSFLIGLGASPVIYVPYHGRPALLPYEGYRRGRVASQAAAFDHFWRLFNRIDGEIEHLGLDPARKTVAEDLRRMMEFLELHIITNLKFFDHRLHDLDGRNYYLEREWRVSHDVEFRLPDVERIIIPREYARELRRDFPRFDGEIVFANRY
jgi:hypothetical protein